MKPQDAAQGPSIHDLEIYGLLDLAVRDDPSSLMSESAWASEMMSSSNLVRPLGEDRRREYGGSAHLVDVNGRCFKEMIRQASERGWGEHVERLEAENSAEYLAKTPLYPATLPDPCMPFLARPRHISGQPESTSGSRSVDRGGEGVVANEAARGGKAG